MTNTASRSEMKQKPFEPIAGAPNESQNAHSLSYIAFYLGELDQKIERVAKALEAIQVSAGVVGAQAVARKPMGRR